MVRICILALVGICRLIDESFDSDNMIVLFELHSSVISLCYMYTQVHCKLHVFHNTESCIKLNK